jgi:hypothetical protein
VTRKVVGVLWCVFVRRSMVRIYLLKPELMYRRSSYWLQIDLDGTADRHEGQVAYDRHVTMLDGPSGTRPSSARGTA